MFKPWTVFQNCFIMCCWGKDHLLLYKHIVFQRINFGLDDELAVVYSPSPSLCFPVPLHTPFSLSFSVTFSFSLRLILTQPHSMVEKIPPSLPFVGIHSLHFISAIYPYLSFTWTTRYHWKKAISVSVQQNLLLLILAIFSGWDCSYTRLWNPPQVHCLQTLYGDSLFCTCSVAAQPNWAHKHATNRGIATGHLIIRKKGYACFWSLPLKSKRHKNNLSLVSNSGGPRMHNSQLLWLWQVVT